MKAMQVVRGLEHLLYEEKLRKLDWPGKEKVEWCWVLSSTL